MRPDTHRPAVRLATLAAPLAIAALLPALGAAQSTDAARLAAAADQNPPPRFTANVNLMSEYRYRGIAQTNSKPAIQGGLDYAHSSGLYAGTWASNVSWLADSGPGVSASVEWDWYGGFKGTAGDVGYDVGGLYYWYPGTYPSGFTSPNTFELYVAGTWEQFTLKYSHALTNLFGFVDSKGAGYLDLTGTFPLGSGWNLVAHAGHQRVPAGSVGGVQVRASGDCSYSDYKLGVTIDRLGLTWGAAYVTTGAKGGVGQCYRNPFDRDLGRGTLLLSVARTF